VNLNNHSYIHQIQDPSVVVDTSRCRWPGVSLGNGRSLFQWAERCECSQRRPETQKSNDGGNVDHPLMIVRGDGLGVRDSIGVLGTAACVYDAKGDVGQL